MSKLQAERALPRSFYLLWAGQSLSAIGDAMTIVAMPLVVLAATGSVSQMGRMTSVALAGALVATATAGFVVDRWDPRRIMIGCDAVRFVLMALVPIAWVLGRHPMWLVFTVGVMAAFAQGVFYVAHVALIARLVGPARAGLANARLQATAALAFVLGPFLAGLLSAHVGPWAALGIDAATFLISGVFLSFVRLVRTNTEPAAKDGEMLYARAKATTGLLAGARFLRGEPTLSRLALVIGGHVFLVSSIVDLFIFRLKHDLGAGDTGTGTMFACASATSVVAALATPWFRRKARLHIILGLASAVQGLFLIVSALTGSFVLITGAAAIFMAAMTSLRICQSTVRQESTPERLLGRVTSSYLLLTSLPGPFGAAAATALAFRYGADVVQAGIGVGLAVVAGVAAFVLRPGSQTHPRSVPVPMA